MIYNVAFFIYKEVSSYTNLTKEEFFDKLWEWTYEDDLWDFLDEVEPTKEELISYLDNVFIDENVFHKWEEDDTSCYAYCIEEKSYLNPATKVFEYSWNQELEDYVMNKVLERYHEEDGQFYKNNKAFKEDIE